MMKKVTGVLHKVSDNRFQLKGNPCLFIWPTATAKQQKLFSRLSNDNVSVVVTVKKIIGQMAIVKLCWVDSYKYVNDYAKKLN